MFSNGAPINNHVILLADILLRLRKIEHFQLLNSIVLETSEIL